MSSSDPGELPTATFLCLEAARRLGLEARVLDPDYGYLFEVRRGATRKVFVGGRSPLNDAVATRIADDKHYAGLLLAEAGLTVPRTVRCLSPRHPSLSNYRDRAGAEPGQALAEELGYPLVVKPNRMSHGRGVRLVSDRKGLLAAIRSAWELDAIALVQETVEGRDMRLDFVRGEYIAGYERKPLAIRGDGQRTLDALLLETDPRFARADRRRRLLGEPMVAAALTERGWTLETVPKEGASLSFDGPIRNLTGPSLARVVDRPAAASKEVALRAGAALSLAHFGVDLKVTPERITVIEVNASPLVSQLYLLGYRERALAAQTKVLAAAFDCE